MSKEEAHVSSKTTTLRRHDSLDIESTHLKGDHIHDHGLGTDKDANWRVVMVLAFQSIGVVYGDLGTSPLYVYDSIFGGGIKHREDVIGTLSIIYYTITILTLVKYVLIVLRAHDNGNGGTFALYSLLCRHAKIGLLPTVQPEDQEVSNYKLELPSKQLGLCSNLKSSLENSISAKFFLLIFTMLATSLVIGDGVLTPCISVLSAVGGLKTAKHIPNIFNDDNVVWIAAGILIFLFGLQRFGTDKVGYAFSPVLLLWFASIAGIGVYNFAKYDPTIIRAVNPWEIVQYFKRNGKEAWISLGGTAMCITGAEALFADLGHFSVRSIQLSTCCIVYPSVMIAYTGQAAYMYTHPNNMQSAFYDSVPKQLYWPMFVVAILASIIASQAMISGTFSIIQQSLSLGCFPRVKVVHTSDKFEGQVYIPEFNYLLMICCVLVTVGFKTTDKIGNAYGIAVVFVLFITSTFMVLVMILIWKTNVILILLYTCTVMFIELVYLSSVLYKFPHGGYLPLAFAAFLMAVMFTWNYVYRKKYHYEMENKLSTETVKEIVGQKSFSRLPGLAIFYSELVHGIPPIFDHYVANVPALHSVVIFVSVKSLPVSKVPPEERFLFRRVYPRDLYVFRCVARYGYIEVRDEQESIESILIEKLKDFIMDDIWMRPAKKQVEHHDGNDKEPDHDSIRRGVDDKETTIKEEEIEREIEVINKACEFGIVHMMGESEVVSEKGSNLGKRFVIDLGYNFLKRVLRQNDKLFDIPRKRLLKVGMMYEL